MAWPGSESLLALGADKGEAGKVTKGPSQRERPSKSVGAPEGTGQELAPEMRPGSTPAVPKWPGLLASWPLTLFQLHREQLQPFHPLLQLVLSRGRHGIHILVATIVVLIGVGAEHLGREAAGQKGRQEDKGRTGMRRLRRQAELPTPCLPMTALR